MSLDLGCGTKPHGLYTKSTENVVYVGDYEISVVDFLQLAEYVLTNTNLTKNDPRRQFVQCVKDMREVEGYSAHVYPGVKRLQSDTPPILMKHLPRRIQDSIRRARRRNK